MGYLWGSNICISKEVPQDKIYFVSDLIEEYGVEGHIVVLEIPEGYKLLAPKKKEDIIIKKLEDLGKRLEKVENKMFRMEREIINELRGK